MKENRIIRSVIDNYGGLPKEIYILFVSRIINRIGGFVYAFLALYMRLKLGYDATTIANFVMLNGALSMLSPFIGGRLADIKGRKHVYVIASAAGAAIFMLCGFLTVDHTEMVPPLLILASVLLNLTGPIGNAMIADIADDEETRRRSYSLLYLGINFGVVIGPILGGFLLHEHIQWFFFGDAITSFISIFLIAAFVKETKLTEKQMKEVKGKEKMEEGFSLLVFLKKPVLLLFTVFSFFSSAVYAQSSFGYQLHLGNFFGEAQAGEYYGFLMSFNAVVVLIFTIVLTELLRKNRNITNIFFAMILNMIGFGMTAFLTDTYWMYFISVFIWTIAEIIMVTNATVFVMGHTPVNYRGRFNALIGFIQGVGFVISPRMMSYFIENHSYGTAWKFIGILAGIAAIGMLIVRYLDKREEPAI